MHLQPVAPAEIGEEHDVVVGGGHEDVLGPVLLAGPGSGHPTSTPPLRAVGGQRNALDVPEMGDGDDHILVGDEVLHVEVTGRAGHDLGAPRVRELLPDLGDLVLNHLVEAGRALQDVPEALDLLDERQVLVVQLLSLEAGKALQTHLEDGVGLGLAQIEAGHQIGPGGGHVGQEASEPLGCQDSQAAKAASCS